jgi:hypothetical protein
MLAQSPDTGMGMGSSTEAPAFSGPFGTRCKYNPLKHLAHRPAIGEAGVAYPFGVGSGRQILVLLRSVVIGFHTADFYLSLDAVRRQGVVEK